MYIIKFIFFLFLNQPFFLPSLIWLWLSIHLWCGSRSVVSDSLQPPGLYSPWNSPVHSTGVGSLCLLQGIFPTQGLNPGLPHCRRILHQLGHQGNTHLWSMQYLSVHPLSPLSQLFPSSLWSAHQESLMTLLRSFSSTRAPQPTVPLALLQAPVTVSISRTFLHTLPDSSLSAASGQASPFYRGRVTDLLGFVAAQALS